MIIVYSTFPSRKKAEETAEKLVRKRLAACVNIFAVDSVYCWQSRIEKGKELSVFIKTEKAKFKQVEKFILKNHPDDTPCILEIPLARVSAKYLKWLKQSLLVNKA